MSPSSDESVNGASACSCVVDFVAVSLFSEDPQLKSEAPAEIEDAVVLVRDDEKEDPSCFPSSEELRLLQFLPQKKV